MIEIKLVLISPKIHIFHLEKVGVFPKIKTRRINSSESWSVCFWTSRFPQRLPFWAAVCPHAMMSLWGHVPAPHAFLQGVSLDSRLYLAARPFGWSPWGLFQSPTEPTGEFLINPGSLRCRCQFIKLWWRREAEREMGERPGPALKGGSLVQSKVQEIRTSGRSAPEAPA